MIAKGFHGYRGELFTSGKKVFEIMALTVINRRQSTRSALLTVLS
jgi:hypothetical protein